MSKRNGLFHRFCGHTITAEVEYMNQTDITGFKVLPGGYNKLETMHDTIMGFLDTKEKQGVRQLLQRNNEACKKLIFPYVRSGENQAAVMTALAGILEAHARECYTIGYIDCIINDNSYSRKEIRHDP
jgi:hypothetical protein